MKIIDNITLYQCDHCGKKLQRRHAMERHEKRCRKNPENIAACQFCAHLKETTQTYTVDYGEPYGEVEKTAKAFRCEKLNKMLYPAKAVHKGLIEKHPETFEDQEQMPRECEHSSFDPGF